MRAGGQRFEGKHFISSMAIRDLIERMDPRPPEPFVRAGCDFNYRDFLIVVLIVKGRELFPDNWIYIHEPRVKVARVQNYNNWSPEMAADPENTCLGLEYFCFEGDELWRLSDKEMIAVGAGEMAQLGLLNPEQVIDATVVRVRKAYPVYDNTYQRGLAVVKDFLETVPNLQLAGRNGMHRYNNQDHSMLTGILAARNIMGGRYDLWRVNAEGDYQEEGPIFSEEEIRAMERTQPLVPMPIR